MDDSVITQYSEEKKKILSKYDERLEKFGPEFRALAVGNFERQIVRFRTLAEIGDLEGKKILDLGCAYGDFYGYLLSRDVKVDYTGYDINNSLLEVAKQKFPSGVFVESDVISQGIQERFDYIFASSTFNNLLSNIDNYSFITEIIRECYQKCEYGVAINFLTSYVDYRHDHAFYYEPEKVFGIAKRIANRVALRHDYCLYEFTLYIKKRKCDWKKDGN